MGGWLVGMNDNDLTMNTSMFHLGHVSTPLLLQNVHVHPTQCLFTLVEVKCTKFDFDWGSAPDPAGELTALPQTP